MELQVLTSKKGTKVVTATALYKALQLPEQHYAAEVKKWLHDVYEFRDGIRRPEGMKDFSAKASAQEPLLKDYYLSVELAKLITLNSRSKAKLKYAKFLCSLEDKVENADLLTREQVVSALELAKAMSLVSCQEHCEQQHLAAYTQQVGGTAANWWAHRAGLLGYTTEKLRQKVKQLGKAASGKSQRQLLMQVDKYEIVRAGVIDLFMAMGKSERYAQNLGALAKLFARELNLDIFDDRQGPTMFPPRQHINTELLTELKAQGQGSALSVWQ